MHTPTHPLFSLHGKRGLVLGLADANSIAYGCARVARAAGAQLVLSCVNDKARAAVQPLADQLASPLVVCNVEAEGALDTLVQNAHAQMGGLDFVVHSIAWAPLADLHGRVVDSSTEGFARAMEISCHSFARLARSCEPLMPEGGSLITMSYLGSQQAVSAPISSRVTRRPSGARAAAACMSSSKSSSPDAARVGTGPGDTAYTRILRGPSSSAM